MSTNSSQSEAPMREHGVTEIIPSMKIFRNKNIEITKHAGDSWKVMETYFRNHELTDVILVAGEKRIPAHRLVLSTASEYFAAMFKSSMGKSTPDEIELTEVDGDALLALVDYCYTGYIELQEENVEALFEVASLLKLSPVIEACRQFQSEQVEIVRDQNLSSTSAEEPAELPESGLIIVPSE